jgi:hypothetical protein
VNGEFGGIFREGVLGAVVDVLLWPMHGGTKENNENLSIADVPTDYKSRKLMIH